MIMWVKFQKCIIPAMACYLTLKNHKLNGTQKNVQIKTSKKL